MNLSNANKNQKIFALFHKKLKKLFLFFLYPQNKMPANLGN